MTTAMHDKTTFSCLPPWMRHIAMMTTALAGALSVVMAAPHATADGSAADLVGSSSSFQSALDQLLQAMQQAANYDATLPFATPNSDAMLMTGLQNTNYELLSAGLSRVTELFNGVVDPDGTFTVDIGPTEPSGAVNFINDTDATTNGDASLLIRDVLGDWAQGPGSFSIHCVSDCPKFSPSRAPGSFRGG